MIAFITWMETHPDRPLISLNVGKTSIYKIKGCKEYHETIEQAVKAAISDGDP